MKFAKVFLRQCVFLVFAFGASWCAEGPAEVDVELYGSAPKRPCVDAGVSSAGPSHLGGGATPKIFPSISGSLNWPNMLPFSFNGALPFGGFNPGYTYPTTNPFLYGRTSTSTPLPHTSRWILEQTPPPVAKAYRVASAIIAGFPVRVLYPIEGDLEEQSGEAAVPTAQDSGGVAVSDGEAVSQARSEINNALDEEESVLSPGTESVVVPSAEEEREEPSTSAGFSANDDGGPLSPESVGDDEEDVNSLLSEEEYDGLMLSENVYDDGLLALEAAQGCDKKRQENLLKYLLENSKPSTREELLIHLGLNGEIGPNILCEDVVALVHEGNRICYDGEHCSIADEWPLHKSPHRNYTELFCALWNKAEFKNASVAEKTYCLYAHGHVDVPISTVALLHSVKSSMNARIVGLDRAEELGMTPGRWGRLVLLKEKVFAEKRILKASDYGVTEYKNISREDVRIVKDSLRLYRAGREILEVNDSRVGQKNKGKEKCADHNKFLQYLEKKGPCGQEELARAIYPNVVHSHRSVVRSVLALRKSGKNIVHDAKNKMFELKAGLRKTSKDDYRLFHWKALDEEQFRQLSLDEQLMVLSDLKYDPTPYVMDRAILLKKFLGEIPGYIASSSQLAKLTLWKHVLRTKKLFPRKRYLEDLTLEVHVNGYDYNCVKWCVTHYNFLMFGDERHKGLHPERDRIVIVDKMRRRW